MMRRTKIDEDMVFPAVRDTFKKKRFRERHPVVFNALVACVTSIIANILLMKYGHLLVEYFLGNTGI